MFSFVCIKIFVTFLVAAALLCGTQMAVGVVCDNREIVFHLVLLIVRGIVISKREGQKQKTETHQSSSKRFHPLVY